MDTLADSLVKIVGVFTDSSTTATGTSLFIPAFSCLTDRSVARAGRPAFALSAIPLGGRTLRLLILTLLTKLALTGRFIPNETATTRYFARAFTLTLLLIP